MIGEQDPHKVALLILQKHKGEKADSGDAEPDTGDSEEGKEEGAGVGPDALKGMFEAMKSGDFTGAYDALRTAVESCKDDY